jgi:hypothetical protein
MVIGLPHLDHVDQICDGCLIGKQRRAPFPAIAKFRPQEQLALIHGDLCGPISPPTPAGKEILLVAGR